MSANNSVNGWRNLKGSGSPLGTTAGNVGDQYFDTTGFNLWQCSVAGTSTTAVWLQMNSSGGGGLIPWNSVAGSATINSSINQGYIVLGGGSSATILLPVTAPFGSVIQVASYDNNYLVATQPGQSIFDGATSGTSAFIPAQNGMGVILLCTLANTEWLVFQVNSTNQNGLGYSIL